MKNRLQGPQERTIMLSCNQEIQIMLPGSLERTIMLPCYQEIQIMLPDNQEAPAQYPEVRRCTMIHKICFPT